MIDPLLLGTNFVVRPGWLKIYSGSGQLIARYKCKRLTVDELPFSSPHTFNQLHLNEGEVWFYLDGSLQERKSLQLTKADIVNLLKNALKGKFAHLLPIKSRQS